VAAETEQQPKRTMSVRERLTNVERLLMGSAPVRRAITTAFHRLYYTNAGQTWRTTSWLGYGALKCPLDMWVYQELIFRLRPDLIVETGTHSGGSAHFMATICDAVGQGSIISIDTDLRPRRPEHPRITYVHGSSVAPDVLAQVAERASGRVMVILDSDHRRDHVLAELEAYSPFVDEGSYLIVEDTNVNGHPAARSHGPGPMEALDEFLPRHPEFRVDPECERLMMTFNPRGYLVRVAPRPA
jgi:cephalosporin hydroxylase